MSAVLQKIESAVAFIKNLYKETPVVGIVLGSGLGSFTAK